MALYTQTFGFRTPFQILGMFDNEAWRGEEATQCHRDHQERANGFLNGNRGERDLWRENELIDSIAGYTSEMSSGTIDL